MKERPILFSDPMVRAILDGRKTQTRRICKPQPVAIVGSRQRRVYRDEDFKKSWSTIPGCLEGDGFVDCPHGQPGDRLWVKETYRFGSGYDAVRPRDVVKNGNAIVQYEADKALRTVGGRYLYGGNAFTPGKTRVSIHMPRCASRITLEIAGVRVERLQDISNEDAIAEGIDPLFTESEIRDRPKLSECRGQWANYLWHGHHGKWGLGNAKSDAWPYQSSGYEDARGSYSSLWESINGAGSWAANPLVWAITFRKVTP